MDLINHGAGSNNVKGSPNKFYNGLKELMSGTKDGPMDLTASDTKSGSKGVLGSSKGESVSNGSSNATGTSSNESKVADNLNTNPTHMLSSFFKV